MRRFSCSFSFGCCFNFHISVAVFLFPSPSLCLPRLSLSMCLLPLSMAVATNISFQFCDCASAMRKFCCKTKYFGICPHAGGNFVCITVCLCGYVCASVRVCIAHKLKCARDILLLLLFCLGVSEFLCCAVAAKLQPLGAVNLVNASGGRACLSPNPTLALPFPSHMLANTQVQKSPCPNAVGSWQLYAILSLSESFTVPVAASFPLCPPLLLLLRLLRAQFEICCKKCLLVCHVQQPLYEN